MKRLYYLTSMLAILSLGACQNEDDLGLQGENFTDVKVSATLETEPSSRTVLNSEKVYWEENDALSVFLGNTSMQKATIIKESMEDTYAQFKISGSGDVILGGGTEDNQNYFANVAYYPYGENVTVSKDGDNYIVSATLPDKQNFKNNSFGTNAYPMIAVTDGLDFGFKNIVGLIHIPLKGTATIMKVTVSSKSHKLAGAYQVTAAANAIPTMEMATEAVNSITLDCGEGVVLNESEASGFDFVLPVGDYEGNDLTFTFYDNNNGYMEFIAANADKVLRSKRTMFSEKTYQVTAYTEDYVQDADGNVVIYTADGLVNAATNLFPNGGTFKIAADIDMTNMQYPSVDFNKDVDFIIDGENHAITGMNMPLINSTWSAGELVKVMNLTLKDPAIAIDVEDAGENVRVGAFIAGPGASDNVVLDNCHIDGGYVKGGHWTGGLVGAADGYNGSDGPVFETLTITKCSVKNCTIESKGSVGGIIGHGAFNAWTLVDMDDITLSGNTIKSTGSSDNKAGSVMGTIGAAQTATVAGGTESKDGYISVDNATIENNTVTSNGTTIDRIYGRQGSSGGTLYIDGVQVVFEIAQLKAALLKNMSEIKVLLADGTYQMPAEAKGKTLTISGTNNAVIEVVPGGQGEANGQLDYSLDGSTVTFNGVTIKTNSQLYAGYARLSAVYNDCVIQNTYNLGTGTSEFNRCTFNITNEYLRVGGATSATFDSCTFNTDGRAILVFQDGTSVAQTVTVKNCTFNATAAANTWNGIHVAAVSIDGTNGTYTVNLEGNNTVDSDFNGLWQIKAGEANVTVNE